HRMRALDTDETVDHTPDRAYVLATDAASRNRLETSPEPGWCSVVVRRADGSAEALRATPAREHVEGAGGPDRRGAQHLHPVAAGADRRRPVGAARRRPVRSCRPAERPGERAQLPAQHAADHQRLRDRHAGPPARAVPGRADRLDAGGPAMTAE